jgi:hypothetical protein
MKEGEQKVISTKFNLGCTYLTRGVNDLVAENLKFAKFVTDSLKRHTAGDWGDLPKEDKESNIRALIEGDRLFSAYKPDNLPTIWIITEAVGDDGCRASTCILFPDEY